MNNKAILTENETLAFEVAKQAVFVNYNHKQTALDIKDELLCSLNEAKQYVDNLIVKGYLSISSTGSIIFG